MELMNTNTKRNWPSLVGFTFVAGAILYPFISIGDNASPFDHFLKAGYGYDNPELDYGEYNKPMMLKALPFEGEDGTGVNDVNTIGDVDSIEEPTTDSMVEISDPIEVSEPIVIPITPEPPAQPPTQSVISDSFPNHLPQEYIGNGHQ